MISLLRVDHRLLHGQVAFSWTSYLGANCILIANDAAARDELRKTTLRMAKPSNCKLIIKTVDQAVVELNEGRADKYQLFIVVESVEDAYRLATKVDRIKTVNIGGLKATALTKPHPADNNINLTEKDEQMLEELKQQGLTVELRMVPNDARKLF